MWIHKWRVQERFRIHYLQFEFVNGIEDSERMYILYSPNTELHVYCYYDTISSTAFHKMRKFILMQF